MQAVYRYSVHANGRIHLTGGIKYVSRWKPWWFDLAFLSLQWYNAPVVKMGRHFVCALSTDMVGVHKRFWNIEKFIVFRMVIL